METSYLGAKIELIHKMHQSLVKKKRLVVSLPLLLIASLFLPSHVVPSAHAALTGLVCITTSTTATSCPASPPAIGPVTVGQTFSVGVFVQGSDAMSAFDIFVKSDPTFVSPVSVALGNLIGNPSPIICINSSVIIGLCVPPGPGLVEVFTLDTTGSNECGGVSPCSGMAFTITYKVVGATSSSSISYPTSPGCLTSSVSSPANTCVLVSDNIGHALSENIQGATVKTSSEGDFGMIPATQSLNVGPGLSSAGSITVTGVGQFTGPVTLTSGAVPVGVTVIFVPNPATIMTAGGSATATVVVFAVSTVPVQTFMIAVTGSDTTGQLVHQLSVTVTVTGAPPLINHLNWNHELSLSLDGPQIWHVFINNTETVPINVVFRITGKSTTNPGNTFDIVCGTTCVNTARKGVNATPGLTPILVPALSTPKQIKINYALNPAFVNQNVKFTITIWITTATGTFYQPTNSFSGTFFVFP